MEPSPQLGSVPGQSVRTSSVMLTAVLSAAWPLVFAQTTRMVWLPTVRVGVKPVSPSATAVQLPPSMLYRRCVAPVGKSAVRVGVSVPMRPSALASLAVEISKFAGEVVGTRGESPDAF